ncbi:MAG: hypothetical protein HWD84_09650 [Flavobacteriaceae bacterium]|nr:hypothetical protein [Flavobacteriaceae bacterium]
MLNTILKFDSHYCVIAAFLLLGAVGLAFPCAANESQPSQFLRCEKDKGGIFHINFFKPSELGPMHCISGLPIADMTLCSPNGAWGLSYPTGTAGLSETTSSCLIAKEHFGGKFASHLGADNFVAQVTFGEGIEVEPRSVSQDMKLSLNR